MFWRHAFLVGSVIAFPVWWYFGVLPLAGLLVVYAYIANKAFESFLRAGPRTSRQVPPTRIAYCQQLSALELSKAYQSGELSCEDVVRTYINHIKHVNPYINVMVFECFEEAMAAAVEADKVWAAWRANRAKPMPSWLLGVPCTIKECMEVTGCPNSSGHPNRRHIISLQDSPVVRNFRDSGAVILGVTNTSELCMWYESSNYVYGISCNPYDTRCLVGGSSGGEGAAAGALFSTFSLGSDIGGSIRMPAFFNGVFGHKVSPHFISNRGQHPSPRTSANHYMATGPISRFAEDLLPLCRVAARGGFLEDPTHFPPRPPMKDALHIAPGGSLRVFALEDFNVPGVLPSASQMEAVHAAARCLEHRYGAKVTFVNLRDRSRCSGEEVKQTFQPFTHVLSMWAEVLTKDASETKFTTLMSEDHPGFNPFLEIARWAAGRSEHTLPAICLCLLESADKFLPQWLLFGRQPLTLRQFKQSLEKLLGDDGVIIAPTFPRPAPRHHHPLFSPFDFQYTAAFNALQMPATAVPIWADLHGKRNVPTPEEAREQGLPEDYHLPKGVQIVSREQHDELILGVAIALERELGGYKYPGWAILDEAPRSSRKRIH